MSYLSFTLNSATGMFCFFFKCCKSFFSWTRKWSISILIKNLHVTYEATKTLRKLQLPYTFGATKRGLKFVLRANGRKTFFIKQQRTLQQQQLELWLWELRWALRSWGEGEGQAEVREERDTNSTLQEALEQRRHSAAALLGSVWYRRLHWLNAEVEMLASTVSILP